MKSRFWLYYVLLCLCCMFTTHAEPQKFEEKMNKKADRFDRPVNFGKFSDSDRSNNSQWEKTFQPKGSDMLKSANLGGKEYKTSDFKEGKTFQLPEGTLLQDKEYSEFNRSSSWSTRSSLFDNKKSPKGFDKSVEAKEYRGPSMDQSRFRLEGEDVKKNLGGIKDIPDRALSVQEVKELLNRDSVGKSSRKASETIKSEIPEAAKDPDKPKPKVEDVQILDTTKDENK